MTPTRIKAERDQPTHIRVPVVVPKDYNEEQTLTLFGMPLPTHVEVQLAPQTVAKIFKVSQFMNQQVVHGASFIDSMVRDNYQNHVTFYLHDFVIPVTEYEDFDRYFKTFSDGFVITVDSSRLPKATFSMRFIYKDGAAREFLFSTEAVQIEY